MPSPMSCKMAPQMNKDQIIAVCLSGRGDKDVFSVAARAGRKTVSRLAASVSPRLKKEGRAAFVPFITAGDPDMETSFAILEKLPAAGADVIELGMPFTDPMADGPAVQASSLRALKSGATMAKVLELVKKFRKTDSNTPHRADGLFQSHPCLWHGALHPRCRGGGRRRADRGRSAAGGRRSAARAGPGPGRRSDPPGHAHHRRCPAEAHSRATPAAFSIMSRSPASPAPRRCPKTKSAPRWRASARPPPICPVAVGFGIRTPEQAAAIARIADGVVVGSAIVSQIAAHQDAGKDKIVAEVLELCRTLAGSTHAARHGKVPA